MNLSPELREALACVANTPAASSSSVTEADFPPALNYCNGEPPDAPPPAEPE